MLVVATGWSGGHRHGRSKASNKRNHHLMGMNMSGSMVGVFRGYKNFGVQPANVDCEKSD